MSKLALSVVAPCCNHEDRILGLNHRISEVYSDHVGDPYELILLNDGSSDSTWKRVSQLFETNKNGIATNLSHNNGYQLSFSAGLQMCSGEYVFIIDANLQTLPNYCLK